MPRSTSGALKSPAATSRSTIAESISLSDNTMTPDTVADSESLPSQPRAQNRTLYVPAAGALWSLMARSLSTSLGASSPETHPPAAAHNKRPRMSMRIMPIEPGCTTRGVGRGSVLIRPRFRINVCTPLPAMLKLRSMNKLLAGVDSSPSFQCFAALLAIVPPALLAGAASEFDKMPSLVQQGARQLD